MKVHSPLMLAATLVAAVSVSQAQESRPAPAEAPATPRRASGEREGAGVRLSPLFAALDTNGDGVIDANEIANAAEALKKLDKNHDGKLTPDEVQPAPRGERKTAASPTASSDAMVARLMQFDKNGDGKLSKDEVPERLQAMFEKADLDKDGFLSKDEIVKLAASQAAATATPARRTKGEKDDDD